MTKGAFWVIGILLLIFTVIGARWVYEGPVKADNTRDDARASDAPADASSAGAISMSKKGSPSSIPASMAMSFTSTKKATRANRSAPA